MLSHKGLVLKAVVFWFVFLLGISTGIVTNSGVSAQVSDPFTPPKYTGILVFGDYSARLLETRVYYYWWGSRAEMPPARVEIIPKSEGPDTGHVLASFELQGNPSVYQVGDLLVAVTMEYIDSSEWPYNYETSIEVWDLGEPTAPERRGHLTTDKLKPNFPLRRLDGSNDVGSVPDGLIFLQTVGRRNSLEVLDLSDPSNPNFAESIDFGPSYKRISLLEDGSDVWVSYCQRLKEFAPDQIYPPYYMQRIDLALISQPKVEEPVNVPGTLLAKDGDNIYTKDIVWGEETVETAISQLVLYDGLAYLQAMQRFEDEIVEDIALDGEGHVIVSHRIARQVHAELLPQHYMTVLDIQNNLEVLAAIHVAERAKLITTTPTRAAFKVPGGLFIINLDDPAKPFAQAYFATSGKTFDILVDDNKIIFAAGRLGFFVYDLDEINLLPPVSCMDDIDCGCIGELVPCTAFTIATDCTGQYGCQWVDIAGAPSYCSPTDAILLECSDIAFDQCDSRSNCFTMSCVDGVCQ
jgi:hypothetical protein